MSLNWPILSVASDHRFWSDYFWKTHVPHTSDGYTSLVNWVEPVTEADLRECAFHHITPPDNHPYCRLEVSVADVTLRLQFDPSIDYISLQLVHRSGAATEVAWDDEAHWHPDLLRWDELALICNYIASLDEQMSHPGIPLLLLCRFAPVTNGDDLERIDALLRQAWHRAGTFTEEQTQVFVPRTHLLGTSVEWRMDEKAGWYLHVNDDEKFTVGLYTLRRLDNPEFPFETLRLVLQAIESHLRA
jgi:hypothetical protein